MRETDLSLRNGRFSSLTFFWSILLQSDGEERGGERGEGRGGEDGRNRCEDRAKMVTSDFGSITC